MVEVVLHVVVPNDFVHLCCVDVGLSRYCCRCRVALVLLLLYLLVLMLSCRRFAFVVVL